MVDVVLSDSDEELDVVVVVVGHPEPAGHVWVEDVELDWVWVEDDELDWVSVETVRIAVAGLLTRTRMLVPKVDVSKTWTPTKYVPVCSVIPSLRPTLPSLPVFTFQVWTDALLFGA